jgi:hypothetical protein
MEILLARLQEAAATIADSSLYIVRACSACDLSTHVHGPPSDLQRTEPAAEKGRFTAQRQR